MNLLFYLVKKVVIECVLFLTESVVLLFLFTFAILSRYLEKEYFIFGSTPIINNKYWSESIKSKYKSLTIMRSCYNINEKSDYDKYFIDFVPRFLKGLPFLDGKYFCFIYLILKTKVLHTSFDGFALKGTYIEFFEPILLKIARIKTVIMPYGGDIYMYSHINDLSLRNVLIGSYPRQAFCEKEIKKRVTNWIQYCDVLLSGAQFDGIPYWTVTPFNMLCIKPNNIKIFHERQNIRKIYSNSPLKVVHSTNHRSIKGTEFLVNAIQSLRDEGYNVELTILENKKNSEVLDIIKQSDILADQFIMGYYGLSAIEGMSLGLPVLCNLENQEYLKLGRRYSFLNECPIISTTPENIKENLKALIMNSALREELGYAGLKFVEKYHSYKTSLYMFESIYEKIIKGKDIDLMNLFHPILSSYNTSLPFVRHPLTNNRIPGHYF